ncbi:hypothetical protein DMN50_13860, partial [Priestia megaterium]
MNKILNSIYSDTIKALDDRSINILEENILILNDILNEIINKSYLLGKSKIYKDLISYLDSIYVKVLQVGLEEKALNNINEVYKIINKEKKVFLYLEDTMSLLIQNIKGYRYSQIEQLNISSLFYNMVVNSGVNNQGILIDNNLPNLIRFVYNSIRENPLLDYQEKKHFLYNIVEEIFFFPIYNKEKSTNDIFFKALIGVLFLLVSKKDLVRLEDVLKIIIERKIHIDSNMIDRIFLTFSTYLYYLSCKEDIEEHDKKEYINILAKLKPVLVDNLQVPYNEDLWTHYKEVKAELNKWEIIGRDVKWLIMGNVVREYFLFLSLVNNINVAEVDESILDEGELFSFINNYFNKNQVSDTIKNNFQTFIDAFSFKRDNLEVDLELLKSQVFSKYKYFNFGNLRTEAKNKTVIN